MENYSHIMLTTRTIYVSEKVHGFEFTSLIPKTQRLQYKQTRINLVENPCDEHI